MAFSLRLPPELDFQARQRAEKLGVPLNALICVALDFYLRGGASAGQSVAVIDELDYKNPGRLSRAGMPLKTPSKPVFVAPSPPPVAVVPARLSAPGPGATKAERKAFTENQRLLRKLGQL